MSLSFHFSFFLCVCVSECECVSVCLIFFYFRVGWTRSVSPGPVEPFPFVASMREGGRPQVHRVPFIRVVKRGQQISSSVFHQVCT